jgi:hypothetical protein
LRVILAAIIACASSAPAARANEADPSGKSQHAARGFVSKAGQSGGFSLLSSDSFH